VFSENASCKGEKAIRALVYTQAKGQKPIAKAQRKMEGQTTAYPLFIKPKPLQSGTVSQIRKI
jgi:hypothetical protein